MQQPPALTPQQEAIREVRTRYERGDLSFDRFEYALNALLQAQTPAECQAIIDELPAAPSSALDVVTPQAAAPSAPRLPRRTRWWIAFMGGLNRMRRPWRLAEQTIGVMVMGGMELDLNLAALPKEGVIRLIAVMGGAKLYVPRSVNVSVHGLTMLGGVNAMGEGSGGILAFVHEESYAEGVPIDAAPTLDIQVFTLMGGIEIVQADSPVITGGLDAAIQAREQARALRRAAHEARHAALHSVHEARRQEREARRQERATRDW